MINCVQVSKYPAIYLHISVELNHLRECEHNGADKEVWKQEAKEACSKNNCNQLTKEKKLIEQHSDIDFEWYIFLISELNAVFLEIFA